MRRFVVCSAKVRGKVLLDSFRLQPKQLQPDYVSSYHETSITPAVHVSTIENLLAQGANRDEAFFGCFTPASSTIC